MTAGRKEILGDKELKTIIESLTSALASIEIVMISTWLDVVTKFPVAAFKEYEEELNKLVKRLRDISTTLYNETDIKKVKNYKDNDSPENFNQYLNVSDNISHLVTQDILYQASIEQSIIVMDRWIHICKIAFHQHDFFIASSVIHGLSSNHISLSGIESKLSPNSVALFVYYRNLYDKPGAIYNRQKSLTRDKLEIIPTLHTLTHAHERVNSVPSNDESSATQKIEVAVKKRAISREFIFLQKKIPSELEKDNGSILDKLKSSPDKGIDYDFEAKAGILKFNLAVHSKTPRGFSKPLSISNFCENSDLRVDFILLTEKLSALEERYAKSKSYSALLYNVRSTLRDAKFTDYEMYNEVNRLFCLDPHVELDSHLKKIHKKIQAILEGLIKDEKRHGKFIKEEELKNEIDSSESFELIVRGISTQSHNAIKEKKSRHNVESSNSLDWQAEIPTTPLVIAANSSSEENDAKTVTSYSGQLKNRVPIVISPRSDPEPSSRAIKLRQHFGDSKKGGRRASISSTPQASSPKLFRSKPAESTPHLTDGEAPLKERSTSSGSAVRIQSTKQ